MKNVIITGANSGLGFETAKKIAKNSDYRVILACRNAEKAAAAKEEIVKETGNEAVLTMSLDTSSLASVRAFADQVAAFGDPVDALVNNAGVSPQHGGTSVDGFELVFATNYLGHFLLVQLLQPYMSGDARIYNVTSDMHNPPGGIAWPGAENLAHPTEDDRRKYSYSKLCMIYLTHALDEKFRTEGKAITVNSFNPGYMAGTNFSGGGGGKGRELMIKATMPDRYSTVEQSSDALAELVTGDAYAKISNEYFDRSTNTAKSSELSYDKANEKELWEASLRYCSLA